MADINTVVFAFSAENVSRLTGLSTHQLAYWDRLGFFSPEYSDETRQSAYSRIYSFRDVVGLKTVALLRKKYGVSFQRLRKFAERLHNYDSSLWARAQVFMLGCEFYVGQPEEAVAENSDGQLAPVVLLEDVISDVRAGIDVLRQRDRDQIGQIQKSRYVARNAATIEGTRIPVATIKRYHEAGFSDEQIIGEYPSLTKADIQAALEFESNYKERVA